MAVTSQDKPHQLCASKGDCLFTELQSPSLSTKHQKPTQHTQPHSRCFWDAAPRTFSEWQKRIILQLTDFPF